MKNLLALLLPLAAALSLAPAHAQLKPPRDPQPVVPAAPRAAPPASARASAPAPANKETADKEAAGKLAAHGWLLLLDRRDWGRSWDSAGESFRKAVPLSAWMDGAPKVRDPLGAFVERTPGQTSYKTVLPGRPEGEYVTAIFLSKFEKGQIEELVTVVREPDGKWRVTGYLPR